MTGWSQWTPAACWRPVHRRSCLRAPARILDSAFIALLPEEKRRGHEEIVIPPRAAGEAEVVIEAHGLTQRFGDFVAVDHVNFRIERGEIFGFLGANGCGKSTTMKMLCGLLPPTEGEAWLFGQSVDANDIGIRRRVGYMSQAFSLYSELSRAAKPGPARPALPRAEGRDSRARVEQTAAAVRPR